MRSGLKIRGCDYSAYLGIINSMRANKVLNAEFSKSMQRDRSIIGKIPGIGIIENLVHQIFLNRKAVIKANLVWKIDIKSLSA